MKIKPIRAEELTGEDSPLQSLFWARAKSILGWKPYAFEINEEQRLLLLVRRIAPLFFFAYVPFGPSGPVDLSMLSEGLKQAIDEPVFAIRYDLPFTDTAFETGGLLSLSYSIQPERTVRIDLQKPLVYRKRALRALKKCENRYTVRPYRGEPILFEQWYETYRQTALRDRFHPRSKEYFFHLLSIDEDKMVKPILLLAFEQEKVVGGVLLIEGKKETIYLAGSSTRPNVGYLLQDGAIRRTKERGGELYDLFGISNQSGYLASLDLFKTAFGGEIVKREPSLDYPTRALRYRLFTVLERHRYRFSRSLQQG
ncbi:MAG TPA: peptidoglycan bridge formation glycyltransferase FemA/FemB family protein [Sphaerochaeta sp.]|nr:peptidoglycan bridge formation glycyltransferase FemA/FemB family protein [Sphaerochaeta sp.]